MSGPELSEPRVRSLRTWDRNRLPVVPRWVGLTALIVVLLAAGGWLIGQQLTSSPATHHRSRRALSATSTYTRFKDPAGAFQIGYPSTWKRVPTSSPQFVLLAEGPNGASYQVAKTTITAPVTLANLGAAKKLTDRVVRSGTDVKLLRKPEVVTLGGLPGYLYLYTFADPSTGELGAHAHYFLFAGKTMIMLVFQSLPSTNFVSLAPLFDRIASTFHALSG